MKTTQGAFLLASFICFWRISSIALGRCSSGRPNSSEPSLAPTGPVRSPDDPRTTSAPPVGQSYFVSAHSYAGAVPLQRKGALYSVWCTSHRPARRASWFPLGVAFVPGAAPWSHGRPPCTIRVGRPLCQRFSSQRRHPVGFLPMGRRAVVGLSIHRDTTEPGRPRWLAAFHSPKSAPSPGHEHPTAGIRRRSRKGRAVPFPASLFARLSPQFGSWNTCPSSRMHIHFSTLKSVVFARNATLPSHRSALTPPGCAD